MLGSIKAIFILCGILIILMPNYFLVVIIDNNLKIIMQWHLSPLFREVRNSVDSKRLLTAKSDIYLLHRFLCAWGLLYTLHIAF